jgi:hypothetical protein
MDMWLVLYWGGPIGLVCSFWDSACCLWELPSCAPSNLFRSSSSAMFPSPGTMVFFCPDFFSEGE